MNIRQTDFTGFTFDGIHSSELNIYRVSDGDRYDEELIPEINDHTTEIPGNNGEYFWGSNYGKRTFSIKIAYDEVTETQFRKIRRLFSTRKVVPLIFDERPYKVYYVKMESPIELNYICFDEKDYEWNSEDHIGYIPGSIDRKEFKNSTRRIYKGEGTIELVAYYPYAHQLYKILDLYYEESSEIEGAISHWANTDEWAHSSGILTQAVFDDFNLDRPITTTTGEAATTGHYNYKIPVYNPGDENTGFYLYIPYDSTGHITSDQGSYIIINGDNATLVLESFTKPDGSDETGIMINTINHLIEGVWFDPASTIDYVTPSWTTTGRVYNDHIVAGDFPKIFKSDWSSLDIDENTVWGDGEFENGPTQAIWINCAQAANARIHYNYLYY